MRLFSFTFAFFLFGFLLNRYHAGRELPVSIPMEPTCAYPNGRPAPISEDGATCYGYDPCGACKDCSRCGHCNSGGRCGVCSGGGSTRSQTNHRNSSSYSRSSNGSSGSTRSSYRAPQYYDPTNAPSVRTVYLPAPALVSATTLNVRNGPGTEYEILVRLTEGDAVTITEPAGESWVKIEVTVSDGREFRTLKGYVFKKYLSF